MRKPTKNWVTCSAACHGYAATDYSWHISRWNFTPRRGIYAPQKGKVIRAVINDGARGKSVDFQVGNTVYEFSHLKDIGVQVGKTYAEGTRIGIMGNTGYSFGTHLHLVIKVNGKRVADPNAWLNAKIAALSYPKKVKVTSAHGANVRRLPTTHAPLSGSRTLKKGDVFTSVKLVSGQKISGNNKWHKSRFGNYVWSGNTNVRK